MAWPRVVSAQMERRRLVAEIFRRACQVFGFCVFGVKGKNPEVPRKTPRFLCSTPGYGAAIPCTLALKLQDRSTAATTDPPLIGVIPSLPQFLFHTHQQLITSLSTYRWFSKHDPQEETQKGYGRLVNHRFLIRRWGCEHTASRICTPFCLYVIVRCEVKKKALTLGYSKWTKVRG